MNKEIEETINALLDCKRQEIELDVEIDRAREHLNELLATSNKLIEKESFNQSLLNNELYRQARNNDEILIARLGMIDG